MSAGLGDELRICPVCGKHIARKRSSPDAEGLMKSAFEARKRGDFDGAVRLYEAVLAEYPDNADAHFGIALCRHGVEFVQTGGKTAVGLLRYLPIGFSSDLSYMRAVLLASDSGKSNFALFAEAVQKEKNAYLQTESMKPCDVIISCAAELKNDGTASAAFTEAKALAARFKKQGISCTVISKALSGLDRRGRAEYFNAERSFHTLVNVLGDVNDLREEPIRSLNDRVNTRNIRGAAHRVITVMSRDFLPKMTRADVRGGMKIMMSPEDRTELAVDVEAGLRGAGRITNAVPLPLNGGRFGDRIKRAFECISIGDFDSAEDICNSVLFDEPSEVSALWGLFLCKNRARRAEETLTADGVAGREILARLTGTGTEGTAGWVKRYLKVLTFNIHIRFIAAFKRRDRSAAERYAEQFRLYDAENAVNDAHRVMILFLGGSAQALLPGAVLACIGYCRTLPFAAGAANIAAINAMWSEIRLRQIKAMRRAYLNVRDNADGDYSRLIIENLKVFCEPAAAFERHTGVTVNVSLPSVADSAGSLWFFAAQYLESLSDKPSVQQEKIIAECFENAAKASPDRAAVYSAAQNRRQNEARKEADRNAPKGAQQLLASAASVLAVGNDEKQDEKKGFWQSFLAVVMFLFSCAAVGAGVIINMRPDALLRFNRALFISLSVGITALFCIFAALLSVMLFRARNVRRHTAAGKAVLSSVPFGTIACSAAAVCLAAVSALTFADRIPTIYLSNIQEFMYLENYPSGNFSLIADIDLDGREINHLRRFSGTFNGNGHTIKNFTAPFFVIEKNTGELRNFVLDGGKSGGIIRTNNGVIENVTVKNSHFYSAVTTTNHAALKNCTVENSIIESGAVIMNNSGTVSNVRIVSSELKSDGGSLCALGDTFFVGGFIGINDGIVSGCTVSELNVESTSAKTHVGGIFGINTGTVTGTKGEKVKVRGKAVTAGVFAARNTGAVSSCGVRGDAYIEAERSFGGFAGENTKQITLSESDVYAEVTLLSDSGEKSCSGGFIGYSSGSVEACTSSGKLFFDCRTDDATAVCSGGAIGLAEGRVSSVTADASLFFTCRKTRGNAESSLGGAVGCIKNASVSDVSRSGRFITVINEAEDAGETDGVAKYQPKYHVGGFAGSVLSDSDRKNETVEYISVDGTVRVNAKKRTFIDFGSVIGYANCEHVISEGIVSGSFGVRSDGYEKVNFCVIIGRTDAVESVRGIAFAGRVNESGTDAGSIGFTGGADGAFVRCYARDNCGTSAVGAEYVPEEVFLSEAFYSDTLGWKGSRWRLADGRLPTLETGK